MILLGQVERAERWLRRALEIDPTDSILLYNVACNYATLGRVEESLDHLERAVMHGIASPGWMRNDKDLESLHGHPRYEALLSKVSEGQAPERRGRVAGPLH